MSSERDEYEDNDEHRMKGVLKGNRWDSTEKRVVLSFDLLKVWRWFRRKPKS